MKERDADWKNRAELLRISGEPDLAEVLVLKFRGDDRFCSESVDGLDPRYPRQSKWIINVSTQFGCPVKCAFCDAGGEFHGNLTTDEILTQIQCIADRHPLDIARCQKLKVHFSRMGEPTLNPSVLECIEKLPGILPSQGLWCCIATVAPQLGTRWLDSLIDLKNTSFHGRFQLQFSINTTDEHRRNELYHLPVWSLTEIKNYGERFFCEGDRKIVLNFALEKTWPFDADRIISRFDPEHFAIKITPLNPTWTGELHGYMSALGSAFEATLMERVDALQRSGFDVILSINDERENVVRSNCGQAVRLVRSGQSLF